MIESLAFTGWTTWIESMQDKAKNKVSAVSKQEWFPIKLLWRQYDRALLKHSNNYLIATIPRSL